MEIGLDFISVLLGALTALVVALPSAFAFRRQWIQARTHELESLARSRGEEISDLLRRNATLETRVDKLEAAMDLLREFKSAEIAQEVVLILSKEGYIHDEIH